MMKKPAKPANGPRGSNHPTPSAPKSTARIATRGRYGRIIRLRPTSNETPTLAEEADRRVVMVMGPSGLNSIVGKPGLTMLSSIGYTKAYVERKLAEGFTFHLLTFPKPTEHHFGRMAVATWKNTLTAIAAAYPEIAHLVKLHAKELKRTSFTSFEAHAGFSFAAVDKLGANDPRFMTLSRLLESPGSACDLRRFLYHVTRLSELYNGDGRTRTEEGKPGVREYIMANRPLTDLGQYELTAIHLNFASEQKLQG